MTNRNKNLNFTLLSVFLALFLCLSTQLFSDALNVHQVHIGPSFSYLRRAKKGGAKSHGDLYGVTAGYDRFKRYGWYWGIEGNWLEGHLNGHTSLGLHTPSNFTEQNAEGRLGYTFQQKDGAQASITPFIGGGYEEEVNKFTSSSEIPLHIKTHYPYATVGFLFRIFLSDSFDAGFNFKARMPYEAKCHISNDPEFEPVSQKIGERVSYRFELPLTYTPFCNGFASLLVKPYYEYRQYPSHPNFPFDYYKNTLKFAGVSAEMQFRF